MDKKNLTYLFPVLLALTGCSNSVVADRELQTKENILISSNDMAQLVQFYKQNLNSDDSYRLKLVKAYLDMKDIKSAELYTNTFTKDDLQSSEYLFTMARLNYLKMNYAKALNFLTRYHESEGDSTGFYHLKGKIFAEQKKYDEAIDNFEKSRQLGLADSVILNDIAVVNIMARKYPEAVEILYNLYLKDPTDEKLRSNLILASINAGRNDIALDTLKDVYNDKEARERLQKLVNKINPKNKLSVVKPSVKKEKSISVEPIIEEKSKLYVKDVTLQRTLLPRISSKFITNKKVFRIQVLATYKVIQPEYLEYLKANYGSVYSYTYELWNRYCIGEFSSLDEAKRYMASLDIKGAFVVEYTNKKFYEL